MQRELEPEVMDTHEEAHGYDAMDHVEPNRAFVDRLKQLGAHGKMIDLGCGPGDIPIMVAHALPESAVFGIDLSRNMLDIAHAKLKKESLGDRVEFHLADVKDLPFEADRFDVVFSNTILHHIPEPIDMLREAWRVLKPDGVLLIRDLFRPDDETTLDQLVQKHAGDCDAYQQKMFRDSLKAALTPDELRSLVADIGMTNIEVVIDTDRHMSLQTVR